MLFGKPTWRISNFFLVTLSMFPRDLGFPLTLNLFNSFCIDQVSLPKAVGSNPRETNSKSQQPSERKTIGTIDN